MYNSSKKNVKKESLPTGQMPTDFYLFIWKNERKKDIFVPDLIAYAFVGVSLSDAKFMGGEY